MAEDIVSLQPSDWAQATRLAHQIVRSCPLRDGICVDATAGNGHDTAFLAQWAGPFGQVHAFDIQPSAIASTQQRVATLDNGAAPVHCHCLSHEQAAETLEQYGHTSLAVVMFNLGWLPGSDKACITQSDASLRAMQRLLPLISSNGLMTVATYSGHEGGLVEHEAVTEWAATLPREKYSVSLHQPINRGPVPPRLIVIAVR